MPVITLNTSDVGCRKPNCKYRSMIPHRHHRRCETFVLSALRFVAAGRSEKYKRMHKRYNEFHPDDVVVVCPWHHCEIHFRYSLIIQRHIIKNKKHVYSWSWKMFNDLMAQLETACREWELEETPGRNPVLCGFAEDDR